MGRKGGLLAPAFCLLHPDIPLAPRSLTLLCFLLSHQDKKLRIFDPRAGPAASQVCPLWMCCRQPCQAAGG